MPYKTIVLALLQERTVLHERLRRSRQLLPTLDRLAKELKTSHQSWMELLALANPQSDPLQISSEAMERAIQELKDHLPNGSSEDDSDPLSLDAAMAFLRRPTPNE